MQSTDRASPFYQLSAKGVAAREAAHQRRKMLARFLDESGVSADDSIFDVGVTSDRSHASSNDLEAWWPNPERIVAVGMERADLLQEAHPGLRFVVANGLWLPFADQSIDVVHSSAIIEHVGSIDDQRALLIEYVRVSRRVVFVTTPNRWFPIGGSHCLAVRALASESFVAPDDALSRKRVLLRRGKPEPFVRRGP